MKTLERNQLLKYIEHAINLESSIVAQEQIIDSYYKASEAKKPIRKLVSYPSYPIKDERNKEGGFAYSWAILGSVFFIPVPLCFFIQSGFLTFLTLISCGFGIWMISKTVTAVSNDRQIDKDYETAKKNYEYMYTKAVEEENTAREKFSNELMQWQTSDSKSKGLLNRNLTKSKQTAEKYYKADIIYPKYRNLYALTSIYEYLESGRCIELTGPQGAYNLYEDELRKNIVIVQLNMILSNLEQIKNNQYMLYQEMKKIQRNTDAIAREMGQIRSCVYDIAQFTELTAFYNGIVAVNTSAMAYFNTL